MSEIGTFETICDVCGFSYDPTHWEHEKVECLQVLYEKALANHQALESKITACEKFITQKDEALEACLASVNTCYYPPKRPIDEVIRKALALTPASLSKEARLEREIVEHEIKRCEREIKGHIAFNLPEENEQLKRVEQLVALREKTNTAQQQEPNDANTTPPVRPTEAGNESP